jgi:uncharacterized protein YeaO (DUF488 family)
VSKLIENKKSKYNGKGKLVTVNQKANMKLKIKRVYEKPAEDDGKRILVDRLWPRGLTKEKAAVDLWLKEIAPSTELRKWFSHDPENWKEFQKRYHQELKKNKEHVSILKEQLRKGVVTLVYGARDEEHNEALVLKEWFSS